ncbi:MAG: DNA polymerase III subunit beta [Bacillota bacterium]
MYLTTTRDNLATAVALVQRAIPSRSPLPVLGGVLLNAEGSNLTLTGSDLELTISTSVPAQVTTPGAVVLPARYLVDIVRRLPEGPVEVEALPEGGGAVLRYGNAQARLAGFPPGDYPQLPELTPRARFSLPVETCRDLVRQVIYAAGQDELRPIFTGVLLEITAGDLCLVATDTHRLAMKRHQVPEQDLELTNVVIPAKAINELYRALGGFAGEVAVEVAENHVAFTSGPLRLLSRLIDGRYPDYRQVLPKSWLTRLPALEVAALLHTVERAAVFGQEEVPVVLCEIEGNTLRVSAQSEVGSLEEKLTVTTEGEPVAVAFNAGYLMDALRACPGDNFDLELNGALGPAVLRPAGDENYVALVLPLRLT